jgi:multiple sugar transport system permease protein
LPPDQRLVGSRHRLIFVARRSSVARAVNIFPLIWTIIFSFTNFRANRNRDVDWVGLRNMSAS